MNWTISIIMDFFFRANCNRFRTLTRRASHGNVFFPQFLCLCLPLRGTSLPDRTRFRWFYLCKRIQISTRPICIVCVCVFFFQSLQQVLDARAQTIFYKKTTPYWEEKTPNVIFGDKNRFFYPKKHKNPPRRQIFVSGLTLNGFFRVIRQ